MKVFVAGASGAIGRPLVRQLVEAGHEVTGTTRREEKAEEIRAAGATAVVCDALDAAALEAAVAAAEPQVVVNQLTAFPDKSEPGKASFFEASNRVRSEGGRNLLAAARAAGARRFLTQSICFLYAPEGEWVKDEDARPYDDAPGPFRGAVEVLLGHEQEALAAEGIETLVLRYGQYYGPGTHLAPDGDVGRQARKRRLPIVGSGEGTFSFIHVEDAAGATVAALDQAAPASTTSATTSRRRCASGCRSTRRRSARSRRAGCPSGSRNCSPAGRPPNRRCGSAAPPTPSSRRGSAGSRAIRAGGRASERR
jgi:nucleoside-diphosphate-sugar epimerase